MEFLHPKGGKLCKLLVHKIDQICGIGNILTLTLVGVCGELNEKERDKSCT